MRLIRDLSTLSLTGCVATIGNFDGVHLGHQAMLQRLCEVAQAKNLPLVMITFEPLPQEFFAGEQNALLRLNRLREKLLLLDAAQVDIVVCVRFNHAFAHLAADQFIQQLLIDQLQVRHLLVGHDFQFGHERTGNIELLKQYSQHFTVETLSPVSHRQRRISSTLIRLALARGDLKLANTLLGYHYFISGRVAHGDQRGRAIGVPTANIRLHDWMCPLRGVFAVRVTHFAAKPLLGVANVGVRPTVDGQRQLLEVHLFDFQQTIYGQCLRVEFLHKLREERRFADISELTRQIQLDVQQAKQWWETHAEVELG
jgi:riboflavin kinase / FMN adenylyltransferase